MPGINLTVGKQDEHVVALVDGMLDITGPQHVDVRIKQDDSVLWVNVNGICVLRICQIPPKAINIDLMGKEG